eukprot:scaffold11932_cov161-Isochrysis_galbana.AAC.1
MRFRLATSAPPTGTPGEDPPPPVFQIEDADEVVWGHGHRARAALPRGRGRGGRRAPGARAALPQAQGGGLANALVCIKRITLALRAKVRAGRAFPCWATVTCLFPPPHPRYPSGPPHTHTHGPWSLTWRTANKHVARGGERAPLRQGALKVKRKGGASLTRRRRSQPHALTAKAPRFRGGCMLSPLPPPRLLLIRSPPPWARTRSLSRTHHWDMLSVRSGE